MMRNSLPTNSRRGVTLLEVLIATFVIGVAILGLASLLPVGSYQIGLANQMDRGSTVGRQAFRKVVVEKMLDPANWAQAQSQAYVFDKNWNALKLAAIDANVDDMLDDIRTWDDYPFTGHAVQNDFGPFTNVDDWAEPFLIDPLLISASGGDISTAVANSTTWPGHSFPLDLGITDVPKMPRITLAMHGTLPDNNGLGLMPLTLAQADRIFRSSDDVVFDFPTDRTKRPTPILSGGASPPANPDPVVGQFTGDYSWSLMVSRSPGEVPDKSFVMATGADLPPLLRKNYTVHVIVYHKRVLSADTSDPTAATERTSFIEFRGGGYGGGSAMLFTADDTLTSDVATKYLTLRPNQWVLIGSFVQQPIDLAAFFSSAGGMKNMIQDERTAIRPVFRWYRVTAAEDAPAVRQVQSGSGNRWTRAISLAGPDWKRDEVPIGTPIFCYLIDNVIGVYEKTVQRD